MEEYKTLYANSFFEQPWWLNIVAPGKWEEVVSKNKNGETEGRLVYVHDSDKVYMPKYTQTLGIWMREDIRAEYGKQKRVINELFEKVNAHKEVVFRLAPENDYILPYHWMGYKIKPAFTYRITNLSDLESLYYKFNKTAKKNIKSASKKVSIITHTNEDVLFQLLDLTFEVQNRKNPMNRKLIDDIITYCDANGCGQYMEARDSDGNVHSCAYFVYDENVWCYLFGASNPKYKSSGAQSLILWEAIKMSTEYSKIFDFEGSMIEGIENFFRQFGGTCTPYYEIRKVGLMKEMIEFIKPNVKKLLGYKV